MWRQIPLVVYAAALSPLLPLAALGRRGIRPVAHRWVLVACLLCLAGDAAGFASAMRNVNNQVVSYLVTPLLSAAMLLALAQWQRSPAERTAIRVMTALLLAASAIGAPLIEDLDNFSQFVIPLGSLLVLAVAIWSLVRRALGPLGGDATRADWFWIPLGFALYSAVTATYFPVSAVFATTDPAFVLAVLKLKSVTVVVAFGAVAWGILCPQPVAPSGPSLSPSS